MSFIHTSKDGTRKFLAGMDDTHLKNTIKLFLQPINVLMDALEVAEEGSDKLAKKYFLLYGKRREFKPEEVQYLLRRTYSKVGPYALEAMLRDSIRDEIAQLMQDAFRRNAVDAVATATHPDVFGKNQWLLGYPSEEESSTEGVFERRDPDGFAYWNSGDTPE